ncbi:MAG: tRNA uridine-5-carboxymethylaminomethyl(34) synthesis enzyme MnmG, partial [Omnitrophica bacterium RIFCSPLOWO2_02_FULL_44_11]
TGTPCRIKKGSIDFTKCEELFGDPDPEPFSYRTREFHVKQYSCWLTYTNEKTHDIIRKNLHRSPLYAGRIIGIGPRYCPSIEDKVVKFADKKRHQIYLEPEGIDTDEIYANGLPTSLPSDVQLEFVHTIQGLENAEVAKFGYAIEYDCMPPTQLKQTLETKTIENLFLAGQVNCTSGYEEAAAQGIYAAFNSICKFKAKEPFILDRSEAYIAVLIDDLITKGTNEPYRMFTSRAEFRLLLRQDNADERLMKYGYEFGLIKKEIYEKMLENKSKAEKLIEDLKSIKSENISLDKWLKRPEMTIESIPSGNLDFNVYSNDILRKVEWDMKYEGYIKRQEMEVSKFKKLEKRKLPEDIDYSKIKGLRREAREKLTGIRPASIGHAARIPGMTNCDISLILVYCKKSL